MLERLFALSARKTNIRTEAGAGLTTFLTMSYIIFVNPAILEGAGMDKDALIAATCIIAAISTLLMGFFANVPIAMAPGMGLNAFFAFTLVKGQGLSWQVALGMTFLAGVLFLILSVMGLREKIVEAIPRSLVTAISAGIGLFLLLIGLENLGLVAGHPETLVTLGKLSPQVLVGLAAFMLMAILMVKKVKGAILIGILLATITGFFAGWTELPANPVSTHLGIGKIAFQLDIPGALKWSLIGPIFALLYIDLFDTLGTIVACSREAGLEEKDGRIKGITKMLGVDAVATMLSGLLGSSPTTSYVESATGIAEGGKTGLTSVVTGLLFLSGLVFIPVIGVVPKYATAPALILVGVLMFRQVVRIDHKNLEEAIPAYLTIALMAFTFSISTGLSFGFLSWGLIKAISLKFKDIHWVMYVVMGLSLLSLLV